MLSGRSLLARSAIPLRRVEAVRRGVRRFWDQPQPICGEFQPCGLVDGGRDLRRHEAAFLCFGPKLVGFGHGGVLTYLGPNGGQREMVPQCVSERSTNDSGKIAGRSTARPRETGDEPVASEPPDCHHEGNVAAGRLLRRHCRQREEGDDEADLETHELGRCASAARGDAVAAPTTKTNSRRRIRSPRRRCPQQCGSRLAQSSAAVSHARF